MALNSPSNILLIQDNSLFFLLPPRIIWRTSARLIRCQFIFFVQQKQRLVRRKDKHRCFSDSRSSDPKEAATKCHHHHHCHTSQRLHTYWTTIKGNLTRHAPPPNSSNPTSSHENVSQSFATRVLPLVGHNKSVSDLRLQVTLYPAKKSTDSSAWRLLSVLLQNCGFPST